MPRGRLRVYLGGPGAATASAALAEARRRRDRGGDVVLATVMPDGTGIECTGDGLGVDVPALLARHPGTVVVDQLAGPGHPGGPHTGRWQDIEDLLHAGIDVITTLDIREVASLADVVTGITGTRPGPGVPDSVLRPARIQVVDTASGIGPGSGTAALRELALRELALRWAADAVSAVRAQQDDGEGASPGEVRERIVVGLSGGPETQRLLDRATRIATRMPGAEIHAVHVLAHGTGPDGSPGTDANALRDLALRSGATYQQVIGRDIAAALLSVAEAEHATQIVVGADAPGRRLARLLAGTAGTAHRLSTLAAGRPGSPDVLMVSAAARPQAAGVPPGGRGLPRHRQLTGFALAIGLPAALTGALLVAGPWVGLAGESLLLLFAVVVTALVGGLAPALVSAVAGSTLLNYFFIPPVHTLRISEPHNVMALVVFVVVAALVSAVVQRAASLAAQAARASAEARSLSVMAGGVLRGDEALPTLLEHIRGAFGMTSAALLEPVPTEPVPTEPVPTYGTTAGSGTTAGPRWRAVLARGANPPATPEEADVTVPAAGRRVLALSGRTLAAEDRALLRTFAARADDLLERDRLARAAAQAARLEASERLRDALLAAVGHDLRTPLASATAAVSSLRAGDVHWSAEEGRELLATADESLQRLARLVADLLDLSRLRAGVLTVTRSPVWLDDVIPPALAELGPPARDVVLHLADDAPPVLADAALLTRVVVNVVGNAIRHSPAGRPPEVTVRADGHQVHLRVVDHGPGVPDHDRERIFVPFQRLGDTDNHTGLGLGLALSRGLAEAMDGVLAPEDTPGGGLTMVLTLPAAPPDPQPEPEPEPEPPDHTEEP